VTKSWPDYHLRLGQITVDDRLPEGCTPAEQRLDETEVGEVTAVTLIAAIRPPEWKETIILTTARNGLG
jgi:hypothetical protein